MFNGGYIIDVTVTLTVNGIKKTITTHPERPLLDVHLVNKTDIPSAGGGETPIIAIAPAIANAVFAAIGVRLRSMPMRGDRLKA